MSAANPSVNLESKILLDDADSRAHNVPVESKRKDWVVHMNGDEEANAAAQGNQGDGSNYERSSIQFPYFDLGECLKIVRAISNNAGADDCTDDQVAAWTDLSSKSSGYRSRMSATRLFGLIESGKSSGVRLSDLAPKALDEHHARAAKVQAFLNVPLFKRVYENWRGQQIPPAAKLERALVTFGVAEKQKARARQTLERSAAEANFYENGKDRLVQPGTKSGGHVTPPADNHNKGSGTGAHDNGGGGNEFSLDPIIRGLINRLPKSGDTWPKSERKLWLGILENSFELVYRDGEKGQPSTTGMKESNDADS